MDILVANKEKVQEILNNYIITHFRKHKIEGINWYCIGVVKNDVWLNGENGVDYIAQVYEDTDLESLYDQVLNYVGCI